MSLQVWDFIGPIGSILGSLQGYGEHGDERRLARELARSLYDGVATVRGPQNMAGVDKKEAVDAVDAVMKAFLPAFGIDTDGDGIPDEWGSL